MCVLLGWLCAENRAVEEGGKNGLCVLLRFFPASFHGGWLLCVLLLPFVGAFLQCSLLHSWQMCVCVCVEVALAQFTAAASPYNILFISQYTSAFFVQRGNSSPCSCPESMNHAWTCAGNTPFSLWFARCCSLARAFVLSVKAITHSWSDDQFISTMLTDFFCSLSLLFHFQALWMHLDVCNDCCGWHASVFWTPILWTQ